MQAVLAIVLGIGVIMAVRRMRFWRRCGWPGAARRIYRTAAWLTGVGVWCAMLLQEWVLWRCGQLTWQTGLPLHLCSMMGILTLPMLLTESRMLWHVALYAGMPGALLALMFPAVLDTPWPRLTSLGFHGLHVLLLLAPLLPMGLGFRPSPVGAVQAWGFLLALGGTAMLVNGLTGSNYLFLAYPVAGTPLTLLAGQGTVIYRLALAGVCTAVLAVEAAAGGWLAGKKM